MPRSIRPRDAWRALAPSSEVPYSQEEQETICAAIDAQRSEPLSDEDRNTLIKEVSKAADLFNRCNHATGGPTQSEIRAALNRLTECARSLREAIELLDDWSLVLMLWQEAKTGELYDAATGEERKDRSFLFNALGCLNELENEAERAQKRLATGEEPNIDEILKTPSHIIGGPVRSSGNSISVFVFVLAEIFEEFVGSRATCYYSSYHEDGDYAGNFLPFVTKCLRPLEDRDRSPAGLGQSVRVALQHRRTELTNRENTLDRLREQELGSSE